MRLDITFRNTEPSEALRTRAEKKFRKVCKHMNEPIEGHLVLKVERHRNSAELTVHGGRDQSFRVHEVTEDMYATLDGLMHKLERAVRRSREKRIDRHHSGEGLSSLEPLPTTDES